MRKTTRQIEVVETHNIALCLDRLNESFGNRRAARALYHAICMSNAFTGLEERTKIREALKLP